MTKRSRIGRWAALILSSILLIAAGLVVVSTAPLFEGFGLLSAGNSDELLAGVAPDGPTHFGPPQSVAIALAPLSPERHMRTTIDAQYARYDNIMVEVKRDGTLFVLGEHMVMDTFKSLLGEQLREQQQTVVTIRPDNSCPFRFVGSVITACNEAGVMHQTEANPVPVTVEPPAGPV